MSSYSPTPSVASAAKLLRAGGTEVSYKPQTAVSVGGFSGVRFDGEMIGKNEYEFFPFTSPHRAKGDHPDGIYMEPGWVFRIIVLNVRGRVVVIYINNVTLPASRFPAFLVKANVILRSLRFPR